MLKKKILAVLCATCIITNLCVTSISAYDGGIPGPNILQSTHYHEDNLEYFRALSLEVMRATNSHQIDGFIEYSYDESIPVGYIYITREDFLTETPERAALKQELLESGFFHFELIDYPYEEFADIGRTMIEYMDKTDFRKLSMIPNENGKLELQFKNSGNLQESYQEILDYLAANVSNFSDDMIYFTYYDEITENIKYFPCVYIIQYVRLPRKIMRLFPDQYVNR